MGIDREPSEDLDEVLGEVLEAIETAIAPGFLGRKRVGSVPTKCLELIIKM